MSGQGAAISGIFRQVLVATGVQNILADKEKPNMLADDIKHIKTVAK